MEELDTQPEETARLGKGKERPERKSNPGVAQ
jgi:hypothetical protein